VGELLKTEWKRLRRRATVECPNCGQGAPLAAKICPHCHQPITAGAAVDAVLEPPRRHWYNLLDNATPTTKRVVQWAYLLLSSLLAWGLLAYQEEHQAEHWFGQAALSVFFLVVLGILHQVILRRQVSKKFLPSTVTKLAFVCNYFTLLMLLQMGIAAWWGRAVTLAGLCGVTGLAFFILRFLTTKAKGPYESGSPYDPSMPQGRQGRFD
jgi:hypothetical protein